MSWCCWEQRKSPTVSNKSQHDLEKEERIWAVAVQEGKSSRSVSFVCLYGEILVHVWIETEKIPERETGKREEGQPLEAKSLGGRTLGTRALYTTKTSPLCSLFFSESALGFSRKITILICSQERKNKHLHRDVCTI